MNDLRKYFDNNSGNLMNKWLHYFEIYNNHFSRFRNKEVNIMEIGVSHGGSLQMWKDYFGPKAKIYGVDINKKCKELEEENIEIFIGSQTDRKFLKDLKTKTPKFDILIDDGGHGMEMQITTFEVLYDHVKSNGVYLCEDCHTSYSPRYEGGYKKPTTYIEYSKNFVDFINAYHSEDRTLKPNYFTKSAFSVHFYDKVVVVEKRPRQEPYTFQLTGNRTLDNININKK